MEKIGTIIKNKMREMNLTPYDLEEDLGRTAATIYKMYEKESLDSKMIMEISIKLGYNFFEYLYTETQKVLNRDTALPYAIQEKEPQILIKELEYLQEKYQAQLEINRLQSEVIELMKNKL